MRTVDHRVTLPRRLPWQAAAAMAVAEPGVRFTACCMGRQAGKTTLLADIAGEYALAGDGRQILHVAPTHDLALIGLERFLSFWRPALREYEATNRRATFWNGASVLWRSADNPDSLLGRTNDLVIVDEAARVGEDALKRAILPSIMARSGRILAVSTPHGARGWFAEWVRRARSEDWPAYRAIRGSSEENPAPNVRAFVQEMREDMPELLYRQEILGEFVADAGQVFRGVAEVPRSTLAAPAPGRSYVLGCDLAKHEDYTVVCAIDTRTGEVGPLDRWRGIPWPQTIDRVAAAVKRWNGAPMMLDSTGVGDPIYDELLARNVPVQGVQFTSESKSRLIVGLASALERHEIRLPDDPGLTAELEAFGYEQLPSGRYRYGAPEGGHDDRVIALALAVAGRHAAALPWAVAV